MIRKHVLVCGQVQGVFFRDFTRQEATARGVSGWVRNLADGRVEAELEGEPEAVESLLERLRDGPSRARVEDLLVTETPPVGETLPFRITR